MKSRISSLPGRFLLLAFLAALLASPVLAGEFERTFTFDSKEMKVGNMIGEVLIVQAAGDEFRVTARVRGKDASEELLEFVTSEGSKADLVVVFPIDDHRKYVYPALGPNRKSTMSFHNEDAQESSWLKKIFHGMSGKKITVRGDGNGLEIWADLTIEVPAGRVLVVKHGVGVIGATDLQADLDLDISSGSITTQNIGGDFTADTGSGSVQASGIQGNVYVDTGSGDVVLNQVEGQKVLVDTGSGSVVVEDIACTEMNVDTGSGQVKARTVGADQVFIDTGSGSVHLQLDRMGAGKFMIDTGSGGITLDLPEGASARISAETGSGRINNQITGAVIKIKDSHELEMTVGEGEARVLLDAGSGSITIK